MNDIERICPHCGSTKVGTSAMYKAKYALAGVGSYAAGYYGGQAGVDLVEGLSSEFQLAKELECKACGYKWKIKEPEMNNQYQQQAYIPPLPAVDTVPDYMIDKQKIDLEDSYRGKATSGLIWTIIGTIVACLSAIYCATNNISSKQMQNTLFGEMEVPQTNWLWILFFILAIVSVIIIVIKIKTYNKYRREVDRLKRMSLQDFRGSWYRHQFK